jgi:hypothetical protein
MAMGGTDAKHSVSSHIPCLLPALKGHHATKLTTERLPRQAEIPNVLHMKELTLIPDLIRPTSAALDPPTIKQYNNLADPERGEFLDAQHSAIQGTLPAVAA